MPTRRQCNQEASRKWPCLDWIHQKYVSVFGYSQPNNMNSSYCEFPTIGQTDQKGSNSWLSDKWGALFRLCCYFRRTQNSEGSNEDKDIEIQDDFFHENEQEVFALKKEKRSLKLRIEELQRDLSRRDQEVITLKRECDQLRTRLSQNVAIQLTEGNPNIADLSDQNRPEKLAEQFSELYDNQWTDCFQVLTDHLGKTEEDSIGMLLKIVTISYDISFNECLNVLASTKDSLVTFAGGSDEKPEAALDALTQEILNKLKSHRRRNFKSVPINIRQQVRKTIMSKIGEQETNACDCFIDECIRTCWLMCIKDPPMYISCDQEDVFDKTKYVGYTEMGHNIAYVVWPALYLHKNGPLMKKGVAQGEDKTSQKQTGKVDTATTQIIYPYPTQPYHTST